MNDDNSKPVQHYKVTLKSGDFGIFSNDNHFDDYPSRLVSGLYNIMALNSNQSIAITPETVASINEVKVCPNCKKEVEQVGSFNCPYCGASISIATA